MFARAFRRGICAASIAIGGIAWAMSRPASETGDRLTIALARLPVFALIDIARAEGYFEKEGVKVEFRTYETGRDTVDQVVRGAADLGTAFDTPVVIESFRTRELAILGTLHASEKNSGIIALRGRGIRKPREIAGKRVGVVEGTVSEYFLSSFLAYIGLGEEAVRRVSIRPEEFLSALRDGTVDAVSAWNPALLEAQEGLPGARIFYSEVHTEVSMLFGLRENLLRKPETVRRFLRALVRAETLFQHEPERAFQVYSGFHPETSPARSRGVWDALTPMLELNNVLLMVLNQEAEWYRGRRGIREPAPEYRALMAPEFLGAVNVEAVTVLEGPGQ